jgi:hypothetical protein
MSTVFLSNLNFSIISIPTTSTSTTLHRCFAKCFHPSKAKVIQQSDSSCTYVGIVTVVHYLHFCSFASSIYPCTPFFSIQYDFAHHLFSARWYFISATIPTSLVNFVFTLQVNIAFSLVRIRYISPVSLVSLSICFHPICPAAFGNNHLIVA